MERVKSCLKSQTDKVANSLNTVVKSASTMRPWLSDFLSPAKFSKPYKSEAGKRLRENLLHYLANYLIMELVIIGLGV